MRLGVSWGIEAGVRFRRQICTWILLNWRRPRPWLLHMMSLGTLSLPRRNNSRSISIPNNIWESRVKAVVQRKDLSNHNPFSAYEHAKKGRRPLSSTSRRSLHNTGRPGRPRLRIRRSNLLKRSIHCRTHTTILMTGKIRGLLTLYKIIRSSETRA